MREIHVDAIRDTVRELCKDAACLLPEDVVGALQTAQQREKSPVAVKVLDQILLNADLAREEMLPLCQDTGTTVIFLDIGQDVHIVGGDLKAGAGGRRGPGLPQGFLRASIVDRPFSARTNTKNNTPPIVHTEIVPGDQLRIQVMPKGGGCENMSRFTIMLPSAGKKGITEFVTAHGRRVRRQPLPADHRRPGRRRLGRARDVHGQALADPQDRRPQPDRRGGRVRGGAAGRGERDSASARRPSAARRRRWRCT